MAIRKKATVLIGIGLIISLFAGLAYGGTFMTGDKLFWDMKECEKSDRGDTSAQPFKCGIYCGFVLGVFDSTTFRFKPPGGIKLAQGASIVYKFLKEHPERLHEPAYRLVIDAFKQAFQK